MTSPPPDPWRDVTAARLPVGSLSALAPVRHQEGVRVLPAGAAVWVRWPTGRVDIVRCLLPVPGVTFFTHREGLWFRFGCLVPTDDAPPEGDGAPVAAVLVPARFEPVPPEPPTWPPVALTVVRGGAQRPATALVCTVAELAKWADTATTAELTAVRAARSGDQAVVLSERLPTIPSACRYWGDKVLVPVGFRPEPALPEATLREAVGVTGGEILLLNEVGAEVIPLAAIKPLTRASVRLGARPT